MLKILLSFWTYSFIFSPTCNWYITLELFGGSQCDAGVPYRWCPTKKNKKKQRWLKIFKNRCMILGIRTRIIFDFLVIIQGSYIISLVSYKNRTKKSSMDSMKSYMILVWNQRNFNPGCKKTRSEVKYRLILSQKYNYPWLHSKSYMIILNHIGSYIRQVLLKIIISGSTRTTAIFLVNHYQAQVKVLWLDFGATIFCATFVRLKIFTQF